ncbi:MAG TPA: ABC transporter ATP-binding protein [Vicinamibacterales bacterium]
MSNPSRVDQEGADFAMLEARHLTKRYAGVPAVKDVSFRVEPGEVLGYLGPNGSGKSTTVNMMIGLVEPTSGEVFFEGRDIQEDLVGFRRRVGYVPEEPNLYPFLSGREYLQLVGRLRRLGAATIERRIDGLLRLLGLDHDGDQSLGSYSKGMRQKILISAALIHDPDVLIFDEPLSGLDVTAALVFKHLVRTLADRGKTILYSSHVLEVVEKLCSRVVVLTRGQVVADDSVERLRELMSRGTLEEVFAELVFREDPERVAREIADTVRA